MGLGLGLGLGSRACLAAVRVGDGGEQLRARGVRSGAEGVEEGAARLG